MLIALVDYTPWGNALFGTAPIPAAVWRFIVPFALGMVALEGLRKWLLRRRFNRPATETSLPGSPSQAPAQS